MPSATSCWKFCSLPAKVSPDIAINPTSLSSDDLRSSSVTFSSDAVRAAEGALAGALGAAAAAAAAAAASSSAFFFSASSRFFLAVLRSKESWRARRKRSCFSFSSASLALASASALLRSSSSRRLRSSSSLRRRSSSSRRLRSSSICFFRKASCFSFNNLPLAMYERASSCIDVHFSARNSMRLDSSKLSTPTPRNTFVLPSRYLTSGTLAFSSIDVTAGFARSCTPATARFSSCSSLGEMLPLSALMRSSASRCRCASLPKHRTSASLSTMSAKRPTSSSKSRWSGKPWRVARTACTTPDVYS